MKLKLDNLGAVIKFSTELWRDSDIIILHPNCALQAELKSDKTFLSYLQQGRLRAMQYGGMAFR